MKNLKPIVYGMAFLAAAGLTQCKGHEEKPATETTAKMDSVSITKSSFGKTAKGEAIDSYKLKNAKGMEVDVITYGGIITHLLAPDKDGKLADVVTGFNDIAQYEKPNPYFGALIGRYGNRIGKGKFTIDGQSYQLPTNDGPNALHGGPEGFHRVVWTAEEAKGGDVASLKLKYVAKDGEQGYPGNLTVFVTYTLNNANELSVVYEATTDKATIVNLTQHTYFNLTGDFNQTILDHEVVIDANEIVPVDATLIPTGKLEKVDGTAFDFRQAKKVGKDIEAKEDQLIKGKGYDHCWVLNNQGRGVRFAASAYDAKSGRLLEVFTDQPGIQFYTGNFLDGTLPQRNGGTYGHRTGFCLETQHYPDGPNQANFPNTVLKPGETYQTQTQFKFSVK
ncbi:aldose epimerase family protein [Flavobacterium caeni]|uniref:Aldose 1-epimerase n=1 Tax=Flavobacterium caeni TaxID=490189 RepID=A0A1G5GDG7_9FLAO|nr:aldose epimerase family protein [Flavobacterium caeni]SCY49349.1 aldose 1-epimerase [Flavobacterium caeni]